MSIDRFKERISNMLFVTTFHERVTQLGRNMTNVMDASTSIKDSESFKELLNVSFFVAVMCSLNMWLKIITAYFDGR